MQRNVTRESWERITQTSSYWRTWATGLGVCQVPICIESVVKKNEMNAIDCLRLKQNYSWWLFSAVKLTYEEFKQSAESPILHHFNDHSVCGTWCIHRDKSQADLPKLKNTAAKKWMPNYLNNAKRLVTVSTPKNTWRNATTRWVVKKTRK